ncbi:hypothetical protein BC939DRAFT_526430, partial [Gamsiella multidivaricata]|uniref:uncharacterized protein n=1 Tax=Gamsiella multidivaricata TaxID=101098 RepID=UPI002220E402
MGSGSSPDLEAAVPQEQYASKGRAQASNSSRPVAAWSPSFPSSSTGPDSESSRHSFTNDNGDAVPPTADTRHPPCTAKSPLRHSTLTATPSPTSTALPPSSSTASTTGARSLSVLNRSSLRNEITSPDSSFSFPSSSSSPSSFSTGFSPRPALPSSITAVLAKASPSPGFAAPHISSSSLLHSATVGANSSAATADKAEMPALMSSSPSNHDLCYEGSHDRNHDSGGHVNETGGTVGSYDQATGADKGSTFVSDAQPRRGPIRSMVKTEEDQEAPRAAAVGTARQGGESGIMGASAYHANDATAGPSAIGETAEGGTGGAAGAGAGAGARARAGAGAGAGAGA